jgi:hypothetical protein
LLAAFGALFTVRPLARRNETVQKVAPFHQTWTSQLID